MYTILKCVASGNKTKIALLIVAEFDVIFWSGFTAIKRCHLQCFCLHNLKSICGFKKPEITKTTETLTLRTVLTMKNRPRCCFFSVWWGNIMGMMKEMQEPPHCWFTFHRLIHLCFIFYFYRSNIFSFTDFLPLPQIVTSQGYQGYL